MKQFTTPEQTTKLIELGFEKPKGWYIDGVTNNIKLYVNIDENPMMFNYSIGELIEKIYQHIIPIEIHYEKGGFDYFCLSLKVYIDGMWCTMLERKNIEPIDFFFEALVKLKKERVIW